MAGYSVVFWMASRECAYENTLTVTCYVLRILVGKELFYKHGGSEGGPALQSLNRPTMIYYLSLKVVLTFGG